MISRRPLGVRIYVVVVTTYTLLVIAMWAWYGLQNGLGYETTFVVASETETGVRSFLYADPLRPFTSLFYHLAYVIGRWVGQDGSFVIYQLVYAVLWLLRGLLVFQIVRMLGHRLDATAFLSGAFAIVHAADTALNWVGQLNQFGFIFWMLLAFFLLLTSFQHERTLPSAIVFAAAATGSAGFCIFSYESPLFLLLAFPILAIGLFDSWSRQKLVLLGVYYLVPAYYCAKSLLIYLYRSGSQGYQISVLRKDWSWNSVLGDWIGNVGQSLAFWRWPAERQIPETVVITFSLLAVAAVVGVHVAVWFKSEGEPSFRPARRDVGKLLVLGLSMVILSFPAYLLLDGATSNWRTQMLSAPGAGIALASAVSMIGLIQWSGRRLGAGIAIAVSAGVCVQGVRAGQSHAQRHHEHWEQHRTILSNVLLAAPRVGDHTLIVLVNRAAEPLIFGHNMWWDVATRLAYPRQAVGGIYFERPAQPAPGIRINFSGSTFSLKSDFPMAFSEVNIKNLLILDIYSDKCMTLTETLPDWLSVTSEDRALYRPRELIRDGPPDARAIRRYGPLLDRFYCSG
jgi:hypothetical protein